MSRPDGPHERVRTAQPAWLSSPPVLYPNEYVWFVLVASLDVMFTWAILQRGGTEVNPIARLVIDAWALPGAIAFKYALTVFVIVVCEIVGRQRPQTGRRLAWVAVAVSAVPPVYSWVLLASVVYR